VLIHFTHDFEEDAEQFEDEDGHEYEHADEEVGHVEDTEHDEDEEGHDDDE
jgi:hypothetical protein